MAGSKGTDKKGAPTNEELEAMFEGIGDEDAAAARPAAAPSSSSSKPTPKPAPAPTPDSSSTATSSTVPAPPTVTADADDDPLAELRNLADRPRLSSSRPGTPRIVSSAATSVTGRGKPTPPSTTSGRSSSDDKPDLASAGQLAAQQAAAAAGSWWGGFSAFASSAIKQAETAVKDLSSNEDALKWADQVRANYANVRGLGGELTSRALPTFTSLIHSIAPPISQHERLQIHTTHDIVGYPSLDPLIYSTFARVMAQVEGGELLVLQRGSETRQRSPSDVGYAGAGVSGLTNGPWYRDARPGRNINAVKGLVEGSKLVRVSAESHAADFYQARGGLEEAAKRATANLSESNPTRSSDIFLALQPIAHTAVADLFASNNGPGAKTDGDSVVVDEPSKPDELVSFAIFLHDPIHSIHFACMSQGLPQHWFDWLDAPASATNALPDAIQDIISAGGIDPREWVSEWLEEALSLAVGTVAQRYVAQRMGVGEGGLGRGKKKEEAVENNGGEAARAI